MNFRENMASLRELSNSYYQDRLSLDEYRKKRRYLLNLLDEDLNGVKFEDDNVVTDNNINGSLVDKALSFLKIAK